QHEGSPVLLERGDDALLHPELKAEPDTAGLRGEHRVRPALDDIALLLECQDLATEARIPLDQGDTHAFPAGQQAMCCRQTGNAPTDDDHMVAHCRLSSAVHPAGIDGPPARDLCQTGEHGRMIVEHLDPLEMHAELVS